MVKKTLCKSLFIAAILMVIGSIAVSAFDDIEKHRSCAQCGMDRKAFGYSRMLIAYEDGTTSGVCSLHCAVNEMEVNKSGKAKLIQVADRNTRSLLAASEAQWVMGGSKRGVMTQQPKWAFGLKADAEAFVKEFGGKQTSWEEVVNAAREEVGKQAR